MRRWLTASWQFPSRHSRGGLVTFPRFLFLLFVFYKGRPQLAEGVVDVHTYFCVQVTATMASARVGRRDPYNGLLYVPLLRRRWRCERFYLANTDTAGAFAIFTGSFCCSLCLHLFVRATLVVCLLKPPTIKHAGLTPFFLFVRNSSVVVFHSSLRSSLRRISSTSTFVRS